MSLTTTRLVAWNILEGLQQPHQSLEDRKTGPLDQAREAAAKSLISELNPDILIINEALYCDTFDGVRTPYAELFALPYALPHLYDAAWGNIILSRFPILDTRRRVIHRNSPTTGGAQNRGASAIRIEIDGKPVWIATHHPHPHRRPEKRAEDFREFLGTMPGEIIIAGDFNAILPEDEPDHAKLVAGFLEFQSAEQAVASVDRMIAAGRHLAEDVLPQMKMRDLISEKRYSIPTILISSDPEVRTAMRIDHAFGTPGIDPVSGRIHHDKRAEIASDHFPLVLDFDLIG